MIEMLIEEKIDAEKEAEEKKAKQKFLNIKQHCNRPQQRGRRTREGSQRREAR